MSSVDHPNQVSLPGVPSSSPVDFDELASRAGKVFVPSAPVNQRKLFAGRIRQLQSVVDAIFAQGQHAVVYGERGVGKTSLASIVQQVVQADTVGAVTVRENCHSGDTFSLLWRRAFESVLFAVQKQKVGFGSEAASRLGGLNGSLADEVSPHDVVTALRGTDAAIVFVFDEFDQIANAAVSHEFAETIKALSDHSTSAKIVIVGVGDNVDTLISSHASIERALVQVRMPRMEPTELMEIISTGSSVLGTTWDIAASRRVVKLAQGLPHYVHRLGLFATREALRRRRLQVTMDDVKVGMREAVESASQSLTDTYLKATSSQRKDSLFGPVLLACALTKSDELGYFRPAWIKAPLKAIGHELDVPTFASHLNKYTTVERGRIMQKIGTDRQWRYRFANPLLQPYVIMRGIAENAVDVATVDQVLGEI